MQDNIDTVISNALLVKKYNLNKKVKDIINSIKESIMNNKDNFNEASNIDIKNNNGFNMDFDIIERIFNNIEKEDVLYGTVTLSSKDDNKVYGKELFSYGNVVVINDGNTYTILEMILKNLLVCNNVILVNNGYMYGVNHLLVEIVREVLSKYKIDSNLVQLYMSENYEEVLNNYANIDLVVVIGNHTLQLDVLNKSKNRTITSGYEYFDIYIESVKNIDFINKIKDTNLNIQYYVKDDLDIEFDNEIRVADLEEAIAQINYNGSRYSTSIFTEDENNASRFMKEVKSSIITVNTSPTIERILDIKTRDLAYEKTVIYPNNLKLDGTHDEIKSTK